MPTYDYRCENCSHLEEVVQKITDEHLTECPACKQPTFKRQISGGNAHFRFKGSGFYITDYCKKGVPSETPSSSCSCKSDHHC